MNKGRLEAFSDAVIAIIVTIMILEFKTPETAEMKALLENAPYFFAYIVTYLFVGVAWYNHHYMFSLTKRVTKRIYWLNNIWLLSMSFLPVATAWAGRFINSRGPEYFYYVVHFAWLMMYFLLSRALADANREVAPEVYQKIYRDADLRGYYEALFLGDPGGLDCCDLFLPGNRIDFCDLRSICDRQSNGF